MAALAASAAATAQPATPSPPQLDATAWSLIDAGSGEELAASDAGQPLPIASATKMMTAWVVLRELSLSDVVRASEYDAAAVESVMGLRPGQFISVRDLLYGLFLASGNDAAHTLAIAAAGSVPRFVTKMNAQARALGLTDTSFANPIGLDQPGNHSSAADLTTLGRRLLAVPGVREITSARSATLGSLRPPLELETRNTLLYELPWADGIKTGYTLQAGYVLVASGSKLRTELVAAVLGTDSTEARDREAGRLLNYGISLYQSRHAIKRGSIQARPEIRHSGDTLPLRAARAVRLGVRPDQQLEIRVRAPDEVEGPIERGRTLGQAVVTLDGRRIATVPLHGTRAVPEAGPLDRLIHSPWRYSALIVATLFVILIVAALIRRRRRQTPYEDWMQQSTDTSRSGSGNRDRGPRR
ncbi:MAG TPA: D-alanyl-D-alanine carboxypeptidase family protein [Solirubrobacterales bacterium]|nr:D-alanyl-D-alanine carboxypeptidase family protein [Solirubrobacterales bacterium]